MPTFTYDKVVRAYKLSEELKAAGYLVETVYDRFNFADPPASEPYCKVVLADSETKDPTPIVDAHDPYTGTAEDLANELANHRTDELRALLKQGAHVVVSMPGVGEKRVVSIQRTSDGKMDVKYET